MTLNELETAIGQRLEAMTDAPPIAWPNQDFTPDGTYIEFRHSPNGRVDETYDAAGARFVGLFLITAVVQSGGFSTAANALAQDIMGRFPKSLRLNAGDGRVVINAPASPGTGFQDGAYWRQPVVVSYVTEGGTSEFTDPTEGLDVSATTDGIERVGDTLRVDIDSLPST